MRVAYNRASLPFSLNQTGTLLNRYLAQFVSAIDTSFDESLIDHQRLYISYETKNYLLRWYIR